MVAVLAGDLPFVRAVDVEVLRSSLGESGAAVAIDDTGRRQPLLAVYRASALRAALPCEVSGARLMAVLDRLHVVEVPLTGTPPPWLDCDTAEDLGRASSWTDDGAMRSGARFVVLLPSAKSPLKRSFRRKGHGFVGPCF